MALVIKGFKEKILGLIPLFLLFYICISEFHTQFYFWKIFSFNLQMILIYYWVLRDPDIIGYGFIFIAGLVNDVILSLPLGISALVYLLVSFVGAYVRNATVRSTLITDWFTFIIAIFLGNITYFFLINKFTKIQLEYVSLFYESLFTFILYPAFWGLFEIYKKFINIKGKK